MKARKNDGTHHAVAGRIYLHSDPLGTYCASLSSTPPADGERFTPYGMVRVMERDAAGMFQTTGAYPAGTLRSWYDRAYAERVAWENEELMARFATSDGVRDFLVETWAGKAGVAVADVPEDMRAHLNNFALEQWELSHRGATHHQQEGDG